ncbi:MAG: NAD(+) diphosphatase [Oscillospiraceae bacterium]|nr:NAD(+) diphosphatase [Oscillospiraceae bacterium]
MIQDIYPYVYDNQYRPEKPSDSSAIIVIKDGKLLVKRSENEFSFPTYKIYNSENPCLTYLFSINEQKFFLAENCLDEACLSIDGYEFLSPFEFRALGPKHLKFAAVTAMQLANWYKQHKLCGCCGKEMVKSEKERMLMCPSCKVPVYPNISPAVIVAITDGDRLLLSRYASGPAKNHYALIAGFNEIGEPIEDTVRREVMEEVGLKVKNIRFYKSQPWSFTGTLLLGFVCDLDGSDTITMDDGELSEAKFVNRNDIPEYKDDISLTSEMIQKFKSGDLI